MLSYRAEEFDLLIPGLRLRGPQQLLKLYGFLHSYLDEHITIDEYVSDERLLAIEARVRIEGRRELTAATLTAAGYGALYPLAAGQAIRSTVCSKLGF